jgi:hypothetical protein
MVKRSIFRTSYLRWLGGGLVCLSVASVISAAPPKTEPKPRPQIVIAPLSPDTIAEAVRAEQDAVLRRLDICDRLRKIGEDTNNSALIQQAEEMQKQVSAIYSARVSRLGVKTPKPEQSTATVEGSPISPKAPQSSQEQGVIK